MAERLEFQLDENFHSKQFEDYVQDLPNNGLPFCCPYLRKLPVDISLRRVENAPSEKFSAGDLVCTERMRYGVDKRCTNMQNVRVEGNQLVMECKWPLGKEIKISYNI